MLHQVIKVSGHNPANGCHVVAGTLEPNSSQAIGFSQTFSDRAPEFSAGAADYLNYIVDATLDDVKDVYKLVIYQSITNAVPVFFPVLQTEEGKKTANVRWQNKNANDLAVLIDVAQSQNSKVTQTTKVVDFMAFKSPRAENSFTTLIGNTLWMPSILNLFKIP